ncbi:MAG: hypothetical protein RLZZ156_2071 [Deinococcota bacterium]|jgi:tRNA dimethylallyltransferase
MNSTPVKTMIPILCGVTASGKTALSLELAESFAVEIISADAMMVYTGLDIGTAKPSVLERKAVPHHLIDIVPPNTNFSVAAWVRGAETAISEILARGKMPLVVGGTGFYIRALSQGLPSTPMSDLATMQRLEVELKAQGLDAMLSELEQFSPEDALKSQRNPRRVLRALEILRGTGKAPSEFAPIPPKYTFTKLALIPPTPLLESRIEQRTKWMFENGLLEETQTLLPIFARDGRRATSFQAIGYKQALDHILGVTDNAGNTVQISLEETERRINLATRQYAKRQGTWFKAEPNIKVFTELETIKAALKTILS